jgi:hypothetical protein
MEAALKTFLAGLKGLRLEIKGENRERISKKSIRDRAAELASMWFNVIAKRRTRPLHICAGTD